MNEDEKKQFTDVMDRIMAVAHEVCTASQTGGTYYNVSMALAASLVIVTSRVLPNSRQPTGEEVRDLAHEFIFTVAKRIAETIGGTKELKDGLASAFAKVVMEYAQPNPERN